MIHSNRNSHVGMTRRAGREVAEKSVEMGFKRKKKKMKTRKFMPQRNKYSNKQKEYRRRLMVKGNKHKK